jgi:hypothetical protein
MKNKFLDFVESKMSHCKKVMLNFKNLEMG